MEELEVNIVRLNRGVSQANSYAVVLKEKSGNRELPIIIGHTSAQSIAIALEDMSPDRPLTHDLIANFFEQLDVTLVSIIIYAQIEGFFYSKLRCEKDGELYEIESRTSDALAIAVRTGSRIYVLDSVLTDSGIEVASEHFYSEEEVESEPEDEFESYSVTELENLMRQSIEEEDYEQAAKLRDVIQKKKQ